MSTDPFPADALDDNRAGRLTTAQRDGLRGRSRSFRTTELQFAVGLVVIGLLVWFAPGPARYATTKPLIGVACIILAGFLVVRSVLGADAVTRDLRTGRVDSIDGAITKWTVSGRTTSSYFVSVGGRRADASRAQYEASPDAGIVKIYFLPTSHRLVNLERLPDRPLPADAMADPRLALADALQGMRSHDAIKSAEARAELAALGNAMKSQVAGDATPPPAAARDPRPLAQAILGTWTNPLLTLSFAGDGSAVAEFHGGRARAGRWSVDGDGHLVSDAMGAQQVAEAWVVGDELTVSEQGQALTFRRTGGQS